MWFKNISLNNTLYRYRTLRDLFQLQHAGRDHAEVEGAFVGFLQEQGYQLGHTDLHEFCYKMNNIQESDTEYIVPVVLAKALVQPYPSQHMIMAKLPEDLADAVCIDYETGDLIEKLPTFEFHPSKELRKLENGYVTNIRYDSNKQRVVGVLHVFKDKLSHNLKGYFQRKEPIGVSIGFAYTSGEPGEFNGNKYDAAQKDILMTHLALLPPNQAIGRCPLPLCGVGIDHNDEEVHESHEHQDKEENSVSDLRQLKTDLVKTRTELAQIKASLMRIITYSLNQLR
jgi:hypothetical protein